MFGFGQGGAFVGRQGLGLFGALRLAVSAQQRKHHVTAVARQGKLALAGKGFQLGKGGVLRGVELLVQRGALAAVVAVLQALGDVGLQRL